MSTGGDTSRRSWRLFIPLVILGCLAFRESYVVTSDVESYEHKSGPRTRPIRMSGDDIVETSRLDERHHYQRLGVQPQYTRKDASQDTFNNATNVPPIEYDGTTKESPNSIVAESDFEDDNPKDENSHSIAPLDIQEDAENVSLSVKIRDYVRSIENSTSADTSPGERKQKKDRRKSSKNAKGRGEQSGTTAREFFPSGREEHNYAIFIVHYHKTGYVLSRELKNLVRALESEAAYPDLKGKRFSGIKHFQSGLDDETGKRFAFDQYGNWPRSAFQTRDHKNETNLPNRFDMSPASLYVQESPDIFADDAAVLEKMNTLKSGTKIIHFVRNPFEMVLSNYFYHR